ncbi:MAG: energy transducer TonB [Bacteroidales bacterium]
MGRISDHLKKFYNSLSLQFNRFLQLNMTGILGTVVFHLLIATVFIGANLSTKQEYPPKEILIEFPEQLNLDKIEALEKMKQDDAQVDAMSDRFLGRNAAVNRADLENKVSEEISTEKYIQELENQMNLPGFKALREGNPVAEQEVEKSSEEEALNLGSKEEKKINKEEKIYKGPAKIMVDLANRKLRFVPEPVYRCQNRGTVLVDISVDQKGSVTAASVNSAKSSRDECLLESALQYARQSLFSADATAPAVQKGTITYEFIAQ